MKYKVLGESEDRQQRSSVEINGKVYFAGEIVDESAFRPRPDNAPEEELSELDSLISTGHIAKV